MRRPLVRAAFAALLVATLAAFFLAQQLKSEFPLVLRFAASPSAISPNGDGISDRTAVGFDLSRTAKVTFSILDSDGNEVRRLVDDRRLRGDTRYRFFWYARDSAGHRVPDGNYHMRLIRRDEGRVINSIKTIRVDTRPPRVRLVSARPGVIATGRGERPRVRIRYRGPRNKAPEFRIFRTDHGPTRVVLRFRGDRSRSALWNGTVRGHPAADGDYAFTVKVRDRAGNATVAPADVPTRANARGGTGVAVRGLTLTGPLGVVEGGSRVRLSAGPVRRRLSFALRRAGSRRVLARGRRAAGAFRVRAPARTGLYLLSVRSAGGRTAWPLAVQARQPPRGRRPLVVLPTATWLGTAAADDDLDGFADSLATAGAVPLRRPLRRLPAGVRGEAEPLLRFLDSAKPRYDLSTDVSLARGQGPGLARRTGIAFAGTERWLPDPLAERLRRYVEAGGRIASFGVDSFHRRVRLARRALLDPTPEGDRDAFGERTATERAPAASLAVGDDQLGLFRGVGFVGEFSLFERSGGLPPASPLLSAAGRDPARPDFVAYRLGRGVVVRVGTPQWAGELRTGAGVAGVTRRLWRLLSR